MMGLVDIFLYIRQRSVVKRRRVRAIARPSKLLHRLRRRRPPIPYPQGPLGGYLVPFAVWDLRRGREHLRRVVIEMYAPTPTRPYWFPVELEVDFLSVCALMKAAPASGYRRVQLFQSIRYRGNRIFFDRDEFYEHDLPLLDRVFPHDEECPNEPPRVRNARPGRHRVSCADRDYRGPCPAPPPSPTRRRPHDRQPRRGGRRWTPRPGTPRPPHGKPAAPDASAREKQPPTQTATIGRPTRRRTRTEGALWRLAGGDAKRYQDLLVEYSDEIDADRAAGRFEWMKNKK
jgi:hypothetical protein